MTKKINNTGVRMIGIALRIMLGNKLALEQEHKAAELYFDNPTLRRAKQDNVFDRDNIQGLLDNIDGCRELMPIFDVTEAPADAPTPVIVGSSEERAGLLKQIADFESKLDQAEETLSLSRNMISSKEIEVNIALDKFSKAQVDITELNAKIETLEHSAMRHKELLNLGGSKAQQRHVEMLEAKISQYRNDLFKSKALNDRLCDQNNNLSIELAKQLEIVNNLKSAVDNQDKVEGKRRERIAELSKQVLDTEERARAAAEENRRHLHTSHREHDSVKRQLRKSQEICDEMCKTNNKIADERDGLRKELACMADSLDGSEFIRSKVLETFKDISDIYRAYVGEPQSMSIDNESLIVNLRIDEAYRPDTIRKIADQLDRI